MKDFLGTDDYEFGDITKKLVSNFTGKDTYKPGDITRAAIDKFFAPRKRKRDE